MDNVCSVGRLQQGGRCSVSWTSVLFQGQSSRHQPRDQCWRKRPMDVPSRGKKWFMHSSVDRRQAYCALRIRPSLYRFEEKQEIWANAHETRNSISLILYSGWLGLSPVISAKILSILGYKVEGRSRSSMCVPPESSPAVLLWCAT